MPVHVGVSSHLPMTADDCRLSSFVSRLPSLVSRLSSPVSYLRPSPTVVKQQIFYNEQEQFSEIH